MGIEPTKQCLYTASTALKAAEPTRCPDTPWAIAMLLGSARFVKLYCIPREKPHALERADTDAGVPSWRTACDRIALDGMGFPPVDPPIATAGGWPGRFQTQPNHPPAAVRPESTCQPDHPKAAPPATSEVHRRQ
jgi:hypothetical protein